MEYIYWVAKKIIMVSSINKCFVCIYPDFLPQTGSNAKSVFKESTTVLNSKFLFFLTSRHNKIEEMSLPCCVRIVGGENYWIHTFSRILVWLEIQTASSKIWTCVTRSISSDNYYNMTSIIPDTAKNTELQFIILHAHVVKCIVIWFEE